jgi:lipoprotein-releasing system permease protein
MHLELYLARRYLAARSSFRFLNLITIIAIGGIWLGVGALIVVIGVMTGLQKEVRDRILGTNPHIMLITYGDELRFEGWESSLEVAREDPEVVLGVPFVYTETLVFKRTGYQQGLVLRGVTSDAVQLLEDQLTVGSWEFESTRSGLPGVVMGFRLANRLLVRVGDTVNVISAENMELTPAGFIPKFEKFEVVGLFKSGMFEYDNTMAYSSLDAAQELIGFDEAITALALYLEDAWRADVVADRIERTLGYPHTARDWMSMNEGLFNALKLEKMAMGIVLFLIVFVAASNIVSTLVMVVADKTREIGILRAMGMTSKGVLKVFMLQGIIIGMIGTFLGLLTAISVSGAIERSGLLSLPGDVYIISEIPITLNTLDVSLIVGGSLLISFLATIYPSIKAARLMPVEAIRHE